MKNWSRILSVVAASFSFTLPIHAQGLLPTAAEGVVTIQSLEVLFSNIVRVIMSLSVVALFLMFVTSGFSFLFSGGDPKKLEQARGTFTNALIGMILIVSAYLILRIISVFTGVDDVMQFTIPCINDAGDCM
jgi:hypothetical protein